MTFSSCAGWRLRYRKRVVNSSEVSPMGLTLKLDVLAVVAAFGFLGAIVFGAF
jgi:uncharacterized membrane protein